MIVIRCNALMPARDAAALINDIHEQARDGVVVVPNFCEVLAVDNDGEVQIIQDNAESTRVAELEELLAQIADMEIIYPPKTTPRRPPRYAGPQNKGRAWTRQPPRVARSSCKRNRR